MWDEPEDKDLHIAQKVLWFLIGAFVVAFVLYSVVAIRVHAEVAEREACAKTCGCFEYEVRDDGCWCLGEPKRE